VLQEHSGFFKDASLWNVVPNCELQTLGFSPWHSNCSDPSGPVNSCNFVAVLYFPIFRLWSCIFLYFYLLLFSVAFIRLLLKYNVYSPLKGIYTSWFLSTVAECWSYAQKYVPDVHNSAKCAFG